MATLTPKISLKKPIPNVETDWAFRLNETIEILDDAMLTTNVSGGGSITVTDDGSGNVTISGSATEGGGGGSNALVGSDGITVTSGDPTDTITGFRTEFVNASGTLQTDIDTNITNIATNVSDIVDNTTLITTTSGHLQSEIDAVEGSDVDSINALAGDIVVIGKGEVGVTVEGQNIVVSGTDHTTDTDTDTVSDAMVGVDGITVLSGTPTASETTISGFRDEFLSASGTFLKNVVEDLTPQLGGDLDVNGKNITTSVANGDINFDMNGTGDVTLTSTDAGSGSGPNVSLIRDSASPAADDKIGAFEFFAENTVSASKKYARMRTIIIDPTNNSEAGSFDFSTAVAGESFSPRMTIEGGLLVGPTVTDKGIGTLNADDIFIGGVSILDRTEFMSASGTLQADIDTKLENIVEDTNPQLGGDLDVNGKSITTSVVNGNINFNMNGTGDVTLTSTDAGSASGPNVSLIRDSASPAADDKLGSFEFFAEDTASASKKYARMRTQIVSPTAGNIAGSFDFSTAVAGESFGPRMTIEGGLLVGPTVTDSGIGTLNADDLFISGVSVQNSLGNKLENIVEDTTPQLGGDLDGDGNSITNVVDMLATGTVSGTASKADTFVAQTDGTISNPAFAFASNPDVGMFLNSPNDLQFIQNGVSFLRFTSGRFLVNGPIQLEDPGSAFTPAFTWEGDTNTGIYQNDSGDNSIAFSTNATRAGFFDASQNLNVTNDVLAGGTVSGTNLKAGGDVTITGGRILSDDGSLSLPAYGFTNDVNAGLFLVTPGFVAMTVGGANVTQWAQGSVTFDDGVARFKFSTSESAPAIQFSNDNDTGIFRKSDDVIGLTAGGTTRLTISGVNDPTDGVGINGNLTVTGTVSAEVGTFATGLTVSGLPVSVGVDTSVTLQEAYDNGDGIITTVAGKPFDLQGTGELTAVTGTFTGLEVSGDIISEGITWTIRTSAANNNWRAVTYGNGLFVAIADSGTGNRVMTSPDGINWTTRTSATDNNWRGIIYGNGLFVAVAISGVDNRVMTSPDGINWTIRTTPVDNQWVAVTYGNGIFVAVSIDGSNNRAMTSPDGINWTIRTSAADNQWVSVTYGNGLFVAIADSGTGDRVMTSPDGINWTIQTSAADSGWTSVTYGNGLFVAVGNNAIMTSPDGITWTSRTSPENIKWFGVTYGNGLFVAVAETGASNRVMTSPDGIAWTSRTSAADNGWRSVIYGNGLFVAGAISGSGDRIMTSGKTKFNEVSTANILQGGRDIRGNLVITGDATLSGTTVLMENLPTASGSLSAGALWVDTSADYTLKVTPN